MKPLTHTPLSGLFLVLLLLLCSCNKYLEEKSNKSLVVPQTVKDLQGLLDDVTIMNNSYPALSQASDDDIFVKPENYNGLALLNQQIYIWESEVIRFGSDWAGPYNAVYVANYCLEKIEENVLTASSKEAWNNVKGSAFFYRGFNFLALAGQYAVAYDEQTAEKDLGIVLRLGSDFNVPSKRSGVAATYTQVISDLKNAATFLPDHPQHSMRPSKAAAYAALSRCYLWMRKYDSAYRYADLSLSLKSDLLNYNLSPVNINATLPFQAYNKETIFFMPQGSSSSLKSPANSNTDTALFASYHKDDLRRTAFFNVQPTRTSFKGNYTGEATKLFGGITTDEIYITRAECAARLGDLSKAMKDVNDLLVTRWATGKYMPFNITDAKLAVETILKERRKELTMRGLRWMDIKRLNKEGANIVPTRIANGKTYTLAPNDKKYALPIPNDIIEITGIEQN